MWRLRSGQKLAHASRLVTRSAAKLPVSAQDQRVVAAGPKTSAGWRLLAAQEADDRKVPGHGRPDRERSYQAAPGFRPTAHLLVIAGDASQ